MSTLQLHYQQWGKPLVSLLTVSSCTAISYPLTRRTALTSCPWTTLIHPEYTITWEKSDNKLILFLGYLVSHMTWLSGYLVDCIVLAACHLCKSSYWKDQPSSVRHSNAGTTTVLQAHTFEPVHCNVYVWHLFLALKK